LLCGGFDVDGAVDGGVVIVDGGGADADGSRGKPDGELE
jgi:hypothetical protein